MKLVASHHYQYWVPHVDSDYLSLFGSFGILSANVLQLVLPARISELYFSGYDIQVCNCCTICQAYLVTKQDTDKSTKRIGKRSQVEEYDMKY